MNFGEGYKAVALKEQLAYVEAYESESFYKLLRKLPPEIAYRCTKHIEEHDLEDEDATLYLNAIIEARKVATTETVLSDESFERLLDEHPDFFKKIETEVYFDISAHLGSGQTAKIHEAIIRENDENSVRLAIKYVITPTEKTLSASGEHDILAEVTRLQKIEQFEKMKQVDTNVVRVPHPLFHHSTEHLQCYGMEKVDGANLEEIITNKISPQLLADLKQSDFAKRPIEETLKIY